jgi:hypothetical protein
MIREQLIASKTCKLAVAKGFILGKKIKYVLKHPKPNSFLNVSYYKKVKIKATPTQSVLQKWLRDVHNIIILLEHGRLKDESFAYYCRIYVIKGGSAAQYKVFEYSNSYEDALEIGLQHALNDIK